MSGQLLLIIIVTLIVFGPAKLSLLVTHLGWLFKKTQQLKSYLSLIWQQQSNALQLRENERKAKAADEQYLHRSTQTNIVFKKSLDNH